MDYYGVQCQVCEMNFENTYGQVGKDFIHVHHIIPLTKLCLLWLCLQTAYDVWCNK